MDTKELLTAAAVAMTGYLVYFHIKAFSYWSSRGVPGPMPWPLFGTNIYYMIYDKIEIEAHWHKKYGCYYGLYESYKPVFRVNDADIVRQVWVKDFSKFTERHSRYVYGDVQRRWVFWSRGDLWNSQRSLLTPMFTSLKMKGRFVTMLDCVNFFSKELQSPKSEGLILEPTKEQQAPPKSKVISRDILMSLALDVIARSFFGIKVDCYKDKNSDFYKRAFDFAFFDTPHYLMWLITPHYILRWLKIDLTAYSKIEYFDKLTQSQIDQRRASKGAKGNDFVQSLMDAQLPKQLSVDTFNVEDDIDNHYNANLNHKDMERNYREQAKQAKFRRFDDQEIRGQATFFFIAGFETTSTTISFCLIELAHQQATQQEVYEELKAQVDALNGGEMSYTDLLTLKKLDAFVSETMRINSVVIEFNRTCTSSEGVVLANTNPPVRLTKGITISACAREIQRDPKLWENSERFDMSRFYPENKEKIKPGSYMPFGIGPRNCIGMRFALLTVKLTLAKTILQYRITPGPSSRQYPPKLARHAFFSQPVNCDFTLTPREGQS